MDCDIRRLHHGQTIGRRLPEQTMVAALFSPPLLSACGASFALTALLTRYARPLCKRIGLIDHPDARKLHRQSTPLVGGLALVCVMLPLGLLATFLTPVGGDLSLLLLSLCAAAVALVGMADDRRPLNPRLRVALGFLLFGGLALIDRTFLVRQLVFPMLDLQFGLYYDWLALLFTALCCVGLVNAVNMADGKNGLVIGLCAGWLTLIGLRAPASDVPFISVILAGLVALLVMNLRGRLFLGDGGAYGLAATIGLLAIRSYNAFLFDPARGISAEVVVLLFLVPVLDSMRLTVTRIARGQSPMAGDRDHLHHHLQDRLGWPAGLYAYLLLALTPAAVAIAFGA